MQASIDEKIIAKEILIKLIENHYIDPSEFPEVEGLLDITLAAYTKILETVSNN